MTKCHSGLSLLWRNKRSALAVTFGKLLPFPRKEQNWKELKFQIRNQSTKQPRKKCKVC